MSDTQSRKDCDVSFIIPCYRSLRTIGFTLRSIRNQKSQLRHEIIVVDSSEDQIASWLKTHFPDVKLLSIEKRLLPGAARNRGVAEACAPTLAFVDADTILDTDWLSTLYPRLSGNENIRLVGGCVRNHNPERMASRVLHWIEFSEFLPGTASGRKDFLSSSNFLISQVDFLERGGFNEDFAMGEDLLFTQSFPGQIFFDGAVGVAHQHRSKWRPVLQHLWDLGFWSGRFRQKRQVRGSWLADHPYLARLLPFYRCPLIARRVFPQNRLQAVISIPFIFFGLTAWAAGFHQGLHRNCRLPEGSRASID